ncbi:MAG: helix-turn-helix domain-containing protein [Pyrinomonadaceae bacterium]
MDSGVSLIKALAATLLTEIDSLENDDISMGDDAFDLAEQVRAFEVKLIKTALVKTQGNQRRAASLLGVKNTTLHNKIKTYGISCIKVTDGHSSPVGWREGVRVEAI